MWNSSATEPPCPAHDHPGFGTSGGEPRFEIDPAAQYRDAVIHTQTLAGTDGDQIGISVASYAGAHALRVAAPDRRVRAVASRSH